MCVIWAQSLAFVGGRPPTMPLGPGERNQDRTHGPQWPADVHMAPSRAGTEDVAGAA